MTQLPGKSTMNQPVNKIAAKTLEPIMTHLLLDRQSWDWWILPW